MVKVCQWLHYTKPNPTRTKFQQYEASSLPKDTTPSQELNINVEHIIKVYNEGTGRFPVWSQSGNQYIMIAYYCDPNAIIDAPFKSRFDKHRLLA